MDVKPWGDPAPELPHLELDAAPFAMIVADAQGEARQINSGWQEMTGMAESVALGHGWLEAVERPGRDRLRHDVTRVASTGVPSICDHRVAGPRGLRWIRWWITPLEGAEGRGTVISAADIHEDRAYQADLYHMATHDALSGLYNRRFFLETLEQALLRGERVTARVSVLYVDLDGFKRCNDEGGHALGDRILSTVASRLRLALRSGDVVARIGGDEFAVLLHRVFDEAQAQAVAARLEQVLSQPVEVEGRHWRIAASVGAAVSAATSDVTAEAVLALADAAMYARKRARREAANVPSPAPSEPPVSAGPAAGPGPVGPVGPAGPAGPVGPAGPGWLSAPAASTAPAASGASAAVSDHAPAASTTSSPPAAIDLTDRSQPGDLSSLLDTLRSLEREISRLSGAASLAGTLERRSGS